MFYTSIYLCKIEIITLNLQTKWKKYETKKGCNYLPIGSLEMEKHIMNILLNWCKYT